MRKVLETGNGSLPVGIVDGTCLVLDFVAPTYETRTKEIVLEEEWVEYIVTPAVLKNEVESFEYALGEQWIKDCCTSENCTPKLCYNDDTVAGSREVIVVESPAVLKTVVHPAVVETIEYEYALTPGGTEWVERPCASPKKG